MRVLPGDDADAALGGELMRRCGTDCGGGGGRVNARNEATRRVIDCRCLGAVEAV